MNVLERERESKLTRICQYASVLPSTFTLHAPKPIDRGRGIKVYLNYFLFIFLFDADNIEVTLFHLLSFLWLKSYVEGKKKLICYYLERIILCKFRILLFKYRRSTFLWNVLLYHWKKSYFSLIADIIALYCKLDSVYEFYIYIGISVLSWWNKIRSNTDLVMMEHNMLCVIGYELFSFPHLSSYFPHLNLQFFNSQSSSCLLLILKVNQISKLMI